MQFNEKKSPRLTRKTGDDHRDGAPDIGRLALKLGGFAQAATDSGIGVRAAHSHHLYFYDSISPIVEADSIDMSRVYMAARYDKGSADYINCPMTPEEYGRFYDALLAAQSVEERDWEKLNYFESCLPIEEIARRGRDTLRFGPMKPVGLRDPRTGMDALCRGAATAGEPACGLLQPGWISKSPEVWRPSAGIAADSGLENARFLRYGQIHRNTYINAPTLLRETLQMKAHPKFYSQDRFAASRAMWSRLRPD